MADRLLLTSARARPFGGRDLAVELGGHDFVVLHGANEAGKSSLAELIAWLVAGPHGDAANAQRFGAPDTRIGGEIHGRFGGADYVASGRFRVPRSGTPKAGDLTAQVGGARFGLPEWRARIGGIDDAVFAAIYRLWGQNLFSGTGEQSQLATIALSALGAATDPRRVIDDLDRLVADASKTRSAGAESVTTLAAEAALLGNELREASLTAGRYEELRQEVERCGEQADRLKRERDEAGRLVAAVTIVRDAAELRRRAATLTDELAATRAVPGGWQPLLNRADVTEICERVATAQKTARDATSNLEQQLHAHGLDRVALERSSATAATVAVVSTRTGAVAVAASALESATTDLGSAQRTLIEARAATDEALHHVPGLDRAALDPAILAGRFRADVTAASGRWAEARAARREADDAQRKADDAVAGAQRALERAQANWQRFGTGLEAEQWRSAPTASGGSDPLRPALVVGGLIGLVAVVAAGLGQWASAAVAAVTAVVAVVALLIPGRRAPAAVAPVAPVAPAAPAGADERMVAAAAAVGQARSHLAQCQGAAVGARQEAERVQRKEAVCRSDLEALGKPFRLTVADSPQRTDHLHSLVFTATEAYREERRCEQAVAHRQAAVNAARDDRDAAWKGYEAAFAAVGIEPPPVDAGVVVAQSFSEALALLKAEQDAQATAAEQQAVFAGLVGPLGADAAGLTPAEVARQLADYRDLQARRAELERRRESTLDECERRLDQSALARRLAGDGHDDVTLDGMAADAQRRQAETEDALARVHQRIGQCNNEMEQLRVADRVSQLQGDLGAVEERRRERALDAAAAGLAAALLREVADEYERTHQPGIVRRAAELARAVAPAWGEILARREKDDLELLVEQPGGRVPARQLSTGGRTLLYTALRLAMAEHDARQRNVLLPLLCDDATVHLDDDRAAGVIGLFSQVSDRHQVLLFTCHDRTVEVAHDLGATVVALGDPPGR